MNLVTKPRLLLILTEFPPRFGGMQTHALALANYLYNKGYSIEVLTYQANRFEERSASVLFDAGLNFSVNRILSRISYWRNIELITSFSKRFKPDIIYSSTVYYGLLSARLDLPVICRCAGNDVMRPWLAYPYKAGSRILSHPFAGQLFYDFFKRFNYPEWIELLFQRKRRQLMIQSARLNKCIMANSEFTAGVLKDIGVDKKNIKIIVGGVDEKRFRPPSRLNAKTELKAKSGIDQNAFIIIAVCRLVAKKGIDFLLRSIPALCKLYPDILLLVVGDGKHKNRYVKLAAQTGVTDHVKFIGKVNQDQIQEYYGISDLFVLASRLQINPVTGLTDAETMGRVLCEANAAGVPVVAARSGGIPSVIRHGYNGLLFEPDNENDFIQKVKLMREQPEKKNRMITNGRHIARGKFDWSIVLAENEKIIHQYLDSL